MSNTGKFIYCCFAGYNYEGCELFGVFSNERECLKHVKHLKAKKYCFDNVYMERRPLWDKFKIRGSKGE